MMFLNVHFRDETQVPLKILNVRGFNFNESEVTFRLGYPSWLPYFTVSLNAINWIEVVDN